MLDDYSQVVRSHQAFVAEVDGEIVGILVLVRTGDRLLLDNVAVRPDRQGKGLGRRLVTLAVTEARQRGYAHLDLYTNEAMTENIRLYQSLGYTVTERTAEYGYRRVYMPKTLK